MRASSEVCSGTSTVFAQKHQQHELLRKSLQSFTIIVFWRMQQTSTILIFHLEMALME